jgi:hypothetical protein
VPKVLDVRAAKGLGNGYSFAGDFYPVWLTSREAMLHHRDLYGREMTREIQTGLFGRPLDSSRPLDPPNGYRTFAYPAFVDIIFWPLAYLPFPTVRVVLAVLLPIATAGGILLWLRAMSFAASPRLVMPLVLLTLCSYPILEALFAEQLALVVGFTLAAALAALTTGRYMMAGTLLALATIKPQMVVLVILFLLLWSISKWRERRRLAESFAVTELLLCTSSLLIWPGWIGRWLGVLYDYRHYSSPPLVVDLVSPRFASLFGPVFVSALIGASIVVAWRVRACSPASATFHLAVALLLTVSVVALVPGQAVYDHIVLLPGIVLVVGLWRRLASSRRAIRWLMAIAMASLLWQWAAAMAIIAIRPLISSERFYSVGVFVLPIRLAEPFPFVLLALLAVVMRSVLGGDLELDAVGESATGRSKALRGLPL